MSHKKQNRLMSHNRQNITSNPIIITLFSHKKSQKSQKAKSPSQTKLLSPGSYSQKSQKAKEPAHFPNGG
ncbi:hypothetical protein LOK49_LG12G02589 [Camellia lanceoleosa]|uniref:Uncharacterized protein n=1 Tax=Camellia lanceoleosa TaxID=1840588 RepID=A0ACC0FSJ7_9ERIC|nr:hypothetical protein LOK49_LG12G02589 [Camellia lanceoleosa]